MSVPSSLIVALGVLAVTALGASALAGTRLSDPTESVEPVGLGDLPIDASLTASPSERALADTQQVAALEDLSGPVRRDGDDVDDLEIGDIDLDFGPEEWLVTAPALEDYDGDGTTEPLAAELDGLVGREVQLLVSFDDDRDDADVYTVDDLAFRDVSGGPGPWETDAPAADRIDRATALRLAAAAVGEGARAIDADAKDDAPVAWEIDVRDADGHVQEVLLDAAGEVVEIRRDDLDD